MIHDCALESKYVESKSDYHKICELYVLVFNTRKDK